MLNREEEAAPQPLRPRNRRWLGIVGGALLLLLLVGRWLATFWTDYLWYASVNQTGVWSTLIFTRVQLVIVAFLVASILLWASLFLADRLSPRQGAMFGSPDEELLARFQDWIAPRVGRVRVLVSAFFGLMIGLGAAVWWEDWLLFREGGSFGIVDPIFNNDLSLYMFKLPFYRDLFGWAFQLFLVIALVTATLHYLNGGIQVQAPVRRVNPGVKVHLSVLFAILTLLKAFGYQLDRWELLYSPRGQVTGASFTDVNAQDPALRLLILISVVAAVILLVNIRFQGWTLPIVAGGLWLFTSVVVGGLYPSFVQRLQVNPDDVNKEREFVAHNIEFTRQAYGLDGVEVRPFAAADGLNASVIAANRDTIDNVRLWDPTVLNLTYKQLQELRTYYTIDDVDVDRYMIDGELTQVMVSARELDENGIPGQGWVNEHLVYTHGFGAVISPANDVSEEGQPAFYVKDIPPVTTREELEVTQPRVYFADFADAGFKLVRSTQPEVDFPIGQSGDLVQFNTYDGLGGVPINNIFKRAAFALRFGDLDTLISSRITTESRVLMVRNVTDRVLRIAPFLEADDDPYLVVQDGRLVWVLDLYTTSTQYPYSAAADTSRLNVGSDLRGNFNYIRNSVKAVVDAHDGTVDFYIVDPTDPLITAYDRIFPGVFKPFSDMPSSLVDHLRYPEDLFRIQSDIYREYHVTDPVQFFSDVDPWQIARDPSDSPRGDLRGVFVDANGDAFRPMLPYYLLMKLPGEDELSFIILQPFTPKNRPNMVSFLMAKSGPAEYGKIIDYTLPADTQADGPGQVGSFINQNPVIAQEFTLLNQQGSRVINGNMLVVPVEESILYIQPIYISAQADSAVNADLSIDAIPEFKRVVVVYEDRIEMRDTLDEALAAVFGVGTGTPTEPDDGTVGVPDDVVSLLADANAAFARADEALRSGDLAGYQAAIGEAQAFIDQAAALIEAP